MKQDNMTSENAIKTLIQAVQVAQAKGAFTLDDAVLVKQAIDVFVKPQEKAEITPESDVKEEKSKK